MGNKATKNSHPFISKADWIELQTETIARQGLQCGVCGVTECDIGFWNKGIWVHTSHTFKGAMMIELRVVHLNNDFRDRSVGNLQALCQSCLKQFNQANKENRCAQNKRERAEAAGQQVLFSLGD